MRRTFVRVVLAVTFIGAGWTLGRAQTQVADFEIAIDSPRGEMKVSCSRGCDWTNAQGGSVTSVTFQCTTERCVGLLNGHGRIARDLPR